MKFVLFLFAKCLRVMQFAGNNRGIDIMNAKNRVTINLTDEEHSAMQQLAADEDRSMAWLGRQAIKSFLRQNGSLKPQSVPRGVLDALGETR